MYFRYSYLLLVSACVLLVEGEQHPLSPFGEKVKCLLPQSTIDKVFAVNFGNLDEFIEANHKAFIAFNEVIGQPTDDYAVEVFDNETTRLQHVANSRDLYSYFTSAISETLKEEGKLDDNNLDELAAMYATQLQDAAKEENDGKIESTLPVLEAANAKFFKSLGLTSAEFSNVYGHKQLDELKKYSDKEEQS